MKPGDLSADEMRRISRTLQERFVDHPDVESVGFGVALRDGKPDPERPFAVRLWVKRKRSERSLGEDRRLPPSLRVRVKRGRNFETLDLPVDIEGLNKIRSTAGVDPGLVTASCIVRWRQDPPFHYGLVTCAHGFKRVGLASGSPLSVTAQSGVLNARLRWQSPDTRRVDAAVVEADTAAMRTWLGGALPQSQRKVLDIGDLPLLCAFKTAGWTHAQPTPTKLLYLTYTPGPIRLSSELPPLRHVVEAQAEPQDTFEPGTSGAAWDTANGLVGIQVAGRVTDGFRSGFAISLRSSLGQAFAALQAQELDVVGPYV